MVRSFRSHALVAALTLGAPVVAIPLASSALADDEKTTVFEAPEGWKAEPAKGGLGPKFAYKLEAAEGDKEGAIAAAYFFSGGGGGLEANVKRWAGMFKQADGSAFPVDKVKQEKIESNGLKITLVEIEGTFTPMSMGGPAADPKGGFRMLAAVIEGPEGPWYLRLVGPEKTVEKHRAKFLGWVKSAKPSGEPAKAEPKAAEPKPEPKGTEPR